MTEKRDHWIELGALSQQESLRRSRQDVRANKLSGSGTDYRDYEINQGQTFEATRFQWAYQIIRIMRESKLSNDRQQRSVTGITLDLVKGIMPRYEFGFFERDAARRRFPFRGTRDISRDRFQRKRGRHRRLMRKSDTFPLW